MSNQTLQKVLNTGYEIIGMQSIDPNGGVEQIPRVAGTNKIIVCLANRSTAPSYIGQTGVTSNGIPLNYRTEVFDGVALSPIYVAFPPLEILTTQPDLFSISGASFDLVNVVYLAEIV